MPVLNDADHLFLAGPVRRVLLGDDLVWETTWPWVERLVPPGSAGPANVTAEIYGSGFTAATEVCWVNAKTPNNAPFASGVGFHDPTWVTTTLHHLAANNSFLVWARIGTQVSNRVTFPIAAL
jgi:hypothetical protein